MILDYATMLEPGTTVRLTTNLSENVVDLAGTGGVYDNPLFIVLQTTEAFNTATTVQADVVTADAANLTTNPETIGSTGSITLSGSDFAAANRLIVIPVAARNLKRYLGLKWTTTGSANTTGKVKAYVTPDVRVLGQMIGVDTSNPTYAKPISLV